MDVRIKQEAPDEPPVTSSSDIAQQHLLSLNNLLMSITSSPLVMLPQTLASNPNYLQQFLATSGQNGVVPTASDVTALATADLALNLAVRQAQNAASETARETGSECAALDLSAKSATRAQKVNKPAPVVTSSPIEGTTPIDFSALKSEEKLTEGESVRMTSLSRLFHW